MDVFINGNIAFLPGSGAAVWFSKPGYAAYSSGSSADAKEATTVLPKEIIKELNIAPWGEDNLFPQHIVQQLDYCGVAKGALDFKARTLYGNGIMWGKITDYDDKGNEIFTPAKKGDHKDVEQFMRDNGNLYRYFTEFNIDWVYYYNCFPELITTKDRKKIARLVVQESCDCRYKQYNTSGKIPSVYISKLWGATEDQFPRFDAKKIKKASAGATRPRLLDNEYIKEVRCIDMYNPHDDIKKAIDDEQRTNIILPVNYPSPNKTYYQLAAWDGSRLGGWVEIASKIPTLIKVFYEQAINIKYHVEIPMTYFRDKYGDEVWNKMTAAEKDTKRKEVLTQMDKYLSGADNAHKTFVSYFEINRHTGKESGHIKITPIDNKSNIDKDLLTSSAANSEILFSMGINPNLPGAGAPGGPYSGSAGSGSNIREAFLVYVAGLTLERQLILEPLRAVQQFNGWDEDLVFRFRDVVLTTLDKGKGTEKIVS